MIVQTSLTPEDFQLLVLRSALRLEVKGMRRSRRPSAATVVKQKFGLKGTNAKVLEQYEAILREKGLMRGES